MSDEFDADRFSGQVVLIYASLGITMWMLDFPLGFVITLCMLLITSMLWFIKHTQR